MMDDKLKAQIYTPAIAGIIKNTSGLCKRNSKGSYIKNWASEKEVRLKIGIQRLDIVKNGHGILMGGAYFPKVRVPLKEQAFETIKIKFSPEFNNQSEFIKLVKEKMPNSTIDILS